MGDDSIATKCTIEELSSPELIDKLNSFIETAGNNEDIDTTNYAKWVKRENNLPTLDFNTIWNGSAWIEKKDI